MTMTLLKYMDDTYCFASLVTIIEKGMDDNGEYLIFDQTIGYPGGGGQPMDKITLHHNNKVVAEIVKCNFNDGRIRYYTQDDLSGLPEGQTIAMQIDRTTRLQNAAYHTAGHWIASIVKENLLLPWEPTKGYHYSDGAYVEFMGDKSLIEEEELKYAIRYAMRIDRQADPQVTQKVISVDEFEAYRTEIVAPKNFTPMPDRLLRLVKFDMYKSVPCGGTHLRTIRELHEVLLGKIGVKNGKIRIRYSVFVPMMIPPS